jgi:hypothetical protein
MNKRRVRIGLAATGLVAGVGVLYTFTSPPVAARPVRLVVTGPEGQRFSGSYVADGVTNSGSAVAPATISLQARDVSYAFKREGGGGEFRVAVYVGDLCRTSTTSDARQGVRGELRYTSDSESYWGAGF